MPTLSELKKDSRNFIELPIKNYQYAWEEWEESSNHYGMTIVDIEKNHKLVVMMQWCGEKTVGKWTFFHGSRFSFVEKQDAVMFKLKFC